MDAVCFEQVDGGILEFVGLNEGLVRDNGLSARLRKLDFGMKDLVEYVHEHELPLLFGDYQMIHRLNIAI